MGITLASRLHCRQHSEPAAPGRTKFFALAILQTFLGVLLTPDDSRL